MIRMTAVKNTVTVPSKPLDGLHTVRERDGWRPSTTRMLYRRNRIRLRWPACPYQERLFGQQHEMILVIMGCVQKLYKLTCHLHRGPSTDCLMMSRQMQHPAIIHWDPDPPDGPDPPNTEGQRQAPDCAG